MGVWIRADTIAEDTSGNGVYVDGVLCKDGQVPTTALPITGTGGLGGVGGVGAIYVISW